VTLPEQLRAIADRLEAADAARRAAILEITHIVNLRQLDGHKHRWGYVAIEEGVQTYRESEVGGFCIECGRMRDGSSIEPIDAGAPMGLGTVGPSATGEGGEQPIEPHPVVEDVASVPAGGRSKRSGPSTSRREAKRTGQDGVGQESAPTAEGSTRIHCPDCGRPAKNDHGLAIHRARSHGVKGASHDRPGPVAFSGASKMKGRAWCLA
jgi:hypothetical protein